jgi:hypothetical protein
VDHAGPFQGKTILVVIHVDAHSKWIEAVTVLSTSSAATIKVLQNLFTTHGIPEILFQTMGPVRSSGILCKKWNSSLHFFTISPGYQWIGRVSSSSSESWFKENCGSRYGFEARKIAVQVLEYPSCM